MALPVAPFFKRSLVRDCRQGRTYLERGGLLVATLICLMSAHAVAAFLGAPGLQLLSSITGLNAFLILLAGPSLFASVVTEEKEDMTLGLVKMTGLGSLWILLGLSVGRLLTACMLLLAQVPFVVLAVALGGVSHLQVIAAYCALAAHLIFISCLGLLCSTVCKRTRRAASLCVALILGFFLVPWAVGEWIKATVAGGVVAKGGFVDSVFGGLCELARDASVFTRIGEVLTTGFSGSPIGFQVLADVGAAALLFLLSWALFNRCTREEGTPAPGRGGSFGLGGRLRRLGMGRAWRNALAWHGFYFTAGGKAMMVVKFALYAALLAGICAISSAAGDPLDRKEFGTVAMSMGLALVCLELAVCHGRAFGEERKSRTLVSIMLIPASTHGIVYRKMLGCLLGMAPALSLFCLGVVVFPDGFAEALGTTVTEPAAWCGVAWFVLFCQLTALFSVLLRRGGLLLAFVVSYFGIQLVSVLIIMFFGLISSVQFGLLMVALVNAAAAVVAHKLALRLLERAAGRE